MLTLASPTRWTGIPDSIAAFLTNKAVVTDLLEEDKKRTGKHRILPKTLPCSKVELSKEEWQLLEEFLATLTKARDATVELQAEKEVTAPCVLEHLLKINLEFEEGMLGLKKSPGAGQPKKYQLMEEEELCAGAQLFRAAVRKELKERFPLDSTDPAVLKEMAIRYGLPAQLHPHHRDHQDAPEAFLQESDKILRQRMEEVAAPLLEELTERYNIYMREGGGSLPNGKRARERGGEGQGEDELHALRRKKRQEGQERGAGQVGSTESERAAEEEPTSTRPVSTPAEVIKALIDNELVAFKGIKMGQKESVLVFWRRTCVTLPLMGLVAAQAFVTPASSASVERVFSQAGLIDTVLRRAMKPPMFETLLYLKVNWDDDLLNITRSRIEELTPKWVKQRAGTSGDGTERVFNIEAEEEVVVVEVVVEEENEDKSTEEEEVEGMEIQEWGANDVAEILALFEGQGEELESDEVEEEPAEEELGEDDDDDDDDD